MVRQTGTWPGCRHIIHEIVLWPVAGLRPEDRGASIPVSEFCPDHLVALALLHVGDTSEIGPCFGAFERVIANIRSIGRSPGPPPARGMASGLSTEYSRSHARRRRNTGQSDSYRRRGAAQEQRDDRGRTRIPV